MSLSFSRSSRNFCTHLLKEDGSGLHAQDLSKEIVSVNLTNGLNSIANPTEEYPDGFIREYVLKQPASGAAGTLSLGNKIRKPTSWDGGAIPYDATNGKTDIMELRYHATADKWDIVNYAKGF